MITFPRRLEEITDGDLRAGGTDLMERRRLGLSEGSLVDLRDLSGLRALEWRAGALWLGARLTVTEIEKSALVRQFYPGLAQAAGGLATPQIRATATLGGNLLQRVRCWYYRHPSVSCLKKGGDTCLARAGDHLYHSCFDLGPCVAPHPSTLGMALLAYEAQVSTRNAGELSIEAIFGDGKDPARENTIMPGEIVTEVCLPTPWKKERAAYFRAISRARAEWPLVEALVRMEIVDGLVKRARVALGGVANIPLRLKEVEARLSGAPATKETFRAASALGAEGAKPLPMTEYKVALIPATIEEALSRAVS